MPYFLKCFDKFYFHVHCVFQFDEHDSGEVTLHNIEPDDFDILLKYAYTGNVDISKANVQSCLIAADYFSVEFVKKTCIKFMITNFDLDNICDVLKFGVQFNFPELVANAKIFLRKNFGEIAQSEHLFKLEQTFLENFFNDDDLVLYSDKASLKSAARETLILNSVLRYLTPRLDGDPADIETLIRTVRFPLIPTDDLKKCLSNYKSCKNNSIIQKYLKLREVAVKYIQEKKRDTSKRSSPEAKEIPESWFRLRKHAVFSFVLKSMRYAAGGQIMPTPDAPEYLFTDCDLQIKQIEIWLRLWDDKTVIGGLTVTHYNPATDETRVYVKGGCHGRSQCSVELQPDEYITQVTIGSGWLIDRMGFETNKGRIFGPFGGSGGSEHSESRPVSPMSYLYDINCDDVVTQESEAIFNLQLRWITFS